MIETKYLAYLLFGFAFLGLTALPLVCGRRLIGVPLLYVSAGALVALLIPDWPVFDPTQSDHARVLVEELTELLLIVALAGAGLAVDREAGRREWQHGWVLLGIVMPLTIGAVFVLGRWVGLGTAAALLLAAVLAPTDPVLTREVTVGGPNEGEDDDVRVSLTAESGLNDGLAFPFVWLAVGLAASDHADRVDWTHWLALDLFWRVAIALAVGWAIGAASAKFVMGPWGDLQLGGRNAGLTLVGTALLVYGATEALHGYGFLAVFVAARAGRRYSRRIGRDDYVRKPHRYSDQFEKMLLAVLLIWLGGFAASGLLSPSHWQEWMVALALIFVIRPLIAFAALSCTRGTRMEHLAIALFGIRGLGSFFYLAFATSHAAFVQADAVWRICVMAVLISILVHGTLAPIIMTRLPSQQRGAEKQVPEAAT